MSLPFPDLLPYPLPAPAMQSVLTASRSSDVLLIGECHGTQEVSRLLLALLDPLVELGYRGLAFELPADQRDDLVLWAGGNRAEPPRFYTQSGGNGCDWGAPFFRADLSGLTYDRATRWPADFDPKAAGARRVK